MDTAIIFVALIGLMVMAYRGASIILIAPVFAVVAALGSEHASLPVFSELYMTKAAEYLKNYYPIFLFGAVFARLMEKGCTKAAQAVRKAVDHGAYWSCTCVRGHVNAGERAADFVTDVVKESALTVDHHLNAVCTAVKHGGQTGDFRVGRGQLSGNARIKFPFAEVSQG